MSVCFRPAANICYVIYRHMSIWSWRNISPAYLLQIGNKSKLNISPAYLLQTGNKSRLNISPAYLLQTGNKQLYSNWSVSCVFVASLQEPHEIVFLNGLLSTHHWFFNKLHTRFLKQLGWRHTLYNHSNTSAFVK